MSGLQMITTKAGRAALINAEHNGTAPLKIVAVGVTDTAFVPNDDMVALPGEMKRLETFTGGAVAADTIHVSVRDDGSESYTVRGFGYWLSNDVLFAVYGQADPIVQKSAQSMLLLAADTTFTTIDVASLAFGDTNFTNPPATVDRQGVVELATVEEVTTGTDEVRAVTPAGLAKVIANHTAAADPHAGYLTPERGDSRYFRTLPVYTSSDTDCDTLLETGVRSVTVKNDRGIIDATHLPAGGDGLGTLITYHGGDFVRQIYTEGGVKQRTWERTGFTGDGNPYIGRAWKLIWDAVSFDPAAKQDRLDYTPVQQGTGIGQLPNAVKIGWAGSALKATVDVTDQGNFVFQGALDNALANKVTGVGIHLHWKDTAGQPTWLFGGEVPETVNVYNPANFKVAYANSAGNANNANTVGGVPVRFAENGAAQPYYVWGTYVGDGRVKELTLFNRTNLAVGSCVAAMFANQLSGQGLQHGGVGGYILNKNKNKDATGLAGTWEQRGQVYDYGSGAAEGNESSAVLWQRIA